MKAVKFLSCLVISAGFFCQFGCACAKSYKYTTGDINEKYSYLLNQFKCARDEINRLQEENYYLRKSQKAYKNDYEKLLSQNEALKNKLAGAGGFFVEVKENTDESKANEKEISDNSNEVNNIHEDDDFIILEKLIILEDLLKTREEKIKNYSERKNEDLRNLSLKSIFFRDSNIKEVKDKKEAKKSEKKEGDKDLFYFSKANEYQEKKNIDKAIENYKLALKENPEMLSAYGRLGIIYAEKGDYKNSIDAFKNYLRLTDSPEEKKLVQEFINKMDPLVK